MVLVRHWHHASGEDTWKHVSHRPQNSKISMVCGKNQAGISPPRRYVPPMTRHRRTESAKAMQQNPDSAHPNGPVLPLGAHLLCSRLTSQPPLLLRGGRSTPCSQPAQEVLEFRLLPSVRVCFAVGSPVSFLCCFAVVGSPASLLEKPLDLSRSLSVTRLSLFMRSSSAHPDVGLPEDARSAGDVVVLSNKGMPLSLISFQIRLRAGGHSHPYTCTH